MGGVHLAATMPFVWRNQEKNGISCVAVANLLQIKVCARKALQERSPVFNLGVKFIRQDSKTLKEM